MALMRKIRIQRLASRLACTFALIAPLAAGCSSGPGDDDDDERGAADEAVALTYTPLRRLTRAELRQTLSDLIPIVEPSDELIRQLPEDPGVTFDNDATDQSASELLIEGLSAIAEDEAARLVLDEERRDEVIGCTPEAVDDRECYDAFVRRFGRRALRRPIGDEEVELYAAAFLPYAVEDDDFYSAIHGTVSALLQDVELVYRIEIGAPIDGQLETQLDGFQVATRLSYLLWGSGPDDALLDAAAAGELASPDGRRAAAERMLEDERARRQLARFHAMWLGYEWSLPTTSMIPPSLRRKMAAEADALFTRVVLDDRSSWFDVLAMEETFLDDELAGWYGDVPAPGSDEATWTSFGDSGRRGLTSLGAFLNVGNKFSDTSPTQRGRLVRERLQCGQIPRPDPTKGADTDARPPTPTECKNDGYRALDANPSCSGCHLQMDPIGYGLERYDLGGRFRTHEPVGEQCPIDGQGVFPGADGEVAFNGPGELAELLLGDEQLASCLVVQTFRFAQGRPDQRFDRPTIDALTASFRDSGDRLDELLVAIAAAPDFALHQGDLPEEESR